MNFNHIVLSTVLVSLLSVAIKPEAAAAVLPDGSYNIFVNTTPTITVDGIPLYVVGQDGAWNSSFYIGSPRAGEQNNYGGFTDNGLCVMGSDSVCRGSSIAGDGFAGRWQIQVSGGNVSVVSMSQDVIPQAYPIGRMFAHYGTITGAGAIDQSTGALTLIPTGRLGATSSYEVFPATQDRKWNVSDVDCTVTGCVPNGNTAYDPMTTTSASSAGFTIHGAPITPLGDIDSNGLLDWSAILVSAGTLGSDWGVAFAGFLGANYYETYNVRIEAAAIPIPATVWLLASGLLGLGAISKRKPRSPSM
jgi:hypothetical protein